MYLLDFSPFALHIQIKQSRVHYRGVLNIRSHGRMGLSTQSIILEINALLVILPPATNNLA